MQMHIPVLFTTNVIERGVLRETRYNIFLRSDVARRAVAGKGCNLMVRDAMTARRGGRVTIALYLPCPVCDIGALPYTQESPNTITVLWNIRRHRWNWPMSC